MPPDPHCADPASEQVELCPTPWTYAVSDIGRRHHRNEDAVALSAAGASSADGGQAVLVVCDGVSTATDSHLAARAAARAVEQVLIDSVPGSAADDAWVQRVSSIFGDAAQAGRDAAADLAADQDPSPPSCTLAAAVVHDNLIIGGNVGDSRVYWLPDTDRSRAVQLGRDDSMANELIQRGMPAADAEATAGAHAITRWLGATAPADLQPHLAHLPVQDAGWLVVCSDGLWNYCSAPADLWALVRYLSTEQTDPQQLARALVDFANDSGGADNITVALARLVPGAAQPSAAR